jgi:hypothetical protein
MSSSRGRHKGMVSFEGSTYRIEQIASRTYGVVRVNDDVRIGTFKTGRSIRVFPEGIESVLLEAIAREAVRTAKTSWVMNPKPTPQPAPLAPLEPESAPDQALEPPNSSRRGWVPA